jgi:hypothetical protein
MATTKASKSKKPTLENLKSEIQEVAQKLYLERSSKHEEGDELSDWLMAEEIVKAKYKL